MLDIGLSITSPAVQVHLLSLPFNTLPAYTGNIGTNCRMPYFFNSTNKQTMRRSHHKMRGGTTSMKVQIPNFYWSPTSKTELGPGAAATVTASIEYPAGTFAQCLFSGSVSGSISNGGTLASDATAVTIPDGADFWVRIWTSCTGGIVFTGDGGISVSFVRDDARGEAMTFAASGVADQTMGGTVANTDGGNMAYPCGLIGTTTRASIFVDGDSRTYGQADVNDGSSDLGELARSVGQYFGYVNVGSYGEGVATTASNYTKRLALSANCTHIVSARGINALRSSPGENKSAATVETEIQAFWAKFTGRPVFHCTIPPVATSSDSFATTANQTIDANNANRVLFNNYIRGAPSPLAGYFELADVIESARDSGKWKVTGSAFGYTGDGIHENQAGYLLEKASGFINPMVFV